MNNKSDSRQIIGIIGSVLMIIGSFLPFASVGFLSVNYINGDGVIVLVLAIISLLVMFAKHRGFSVITTLAALCVVVYDLINMYSAAEDTIFTPSIGGAPIAIIVGGILALIGSTSSSGNKNNNDSVSDYKFCATCGAKIEKKSTFCNDCGSKQP